MSLETVKQANELLLKAEKASAVFTQLSQEHVDMILKAVYEVVFKNRVRLAKMAA